MQAGSFDLTTDLENPTWFTASPLTATIPFANNNNNVTTQDFCISANGIHNDLEVVISQVMIARPGFDAGYNIVYKNKGNQPLSGNVSFDYDDAVLDFVSSIVVPNTQTTGTYKAFHGPPFLIFNCFNNGLLLHFKTVKLVT